MSDPLKAALFICRAHGANLLALRGIMKDARVEHAELLSSCCTPGGLDQIELHLRGRTAQALLVVGCRAEHLIHYQQMAMNVGIPPERVAVVPAEACHTVNATELALVRVLDARAASHPLERKFTNVLVIGKGASAEAALSQAEIEGLKVCSLEPEEALEPGARLLGGPGRFVLEAGESICEFGAALLVLDQVQKVQRDRLGDRQGTLVVLTGGEDCADAFLEELETGLRGGRTYAAVQETPFTGLREVAYRDVQLRGVTFLRTSELEVVPEGVRLRDEHLGGEVLLPVGELVTVSASRPELADALLSLFGLPAGWIAADLRPGESGAPGIFLGGSAFTTFSGTETARAVRASMVLLAREIGSPADLTPLARVLPEKCSLCLTCLRLCPYRAPFLQNGEMVISLERCRGCGMCLSMCPSQAIEMPPTDLRAEVGGSGMGGAPK
ncbi:MAG: 4Fe-4S binding protein [Methanomassiliicoccales archaeon]|nr:4Fe-4S binding protein [Methanomassiliicoccales archaeon]